MHFHRKRHTACDISILEKDNTRHVVVKALLDDTFDVKCKEIESLKNKFYHEKVNVDKEQAIHLCLSTSEQCNDLWKEERRKRITGSICRDVYMYTKNRNPISVTERIFRRRLLSM